MGKNKNKIKFGIKNAHAIPITAIDASKTDGTAYTYGSAIKLPGAQSVNLPSQFASEAVWADDIEYATLTANQGYDGTIQIVDIPEEFEEEILGDVNGLENSESRIKEFAFCFEFSGDVNKARICCYHVALTKRPDIIHNTKTNSLSVDNDTLNIRVKPRLDTNDIKLKIYQDDDDYETVLTTPPNPVTRRTPVDP